jgi:hypothetical protein
VKSCAPPARIEGEPGDTSTTTPAGVLSPDDVSFVELEQPIKKSAAQTNARKTRWLNTAPPTKLASFVNPARGKKFRRSGIFLHFV